MTEHQIEIRVERMFDALDRELITGKIRQAQYDRRAKAISEWAKRQYSNR